MIPRFSLARPRDLPEAFAEFAMGDGDVAYLAGGTELLQVMKMGLAQFRTLVDLARLPELRGIERDSDGTVRIGAATTHREIERSETIRLALPALAQLARRIANVRVRSTGTLGGNLAFAEPHSDPATFLLACGARVELAGPNGRRDLSMAEFTIGPLQTAREPEEILICVRIPGARAAEGRAYQKIAFFERPAASVAVCLRVLGGLIADATVAVGSCTEAPLVLTATSQALVGVEARPEAVETVLLDARAALGTIDVVSDLNGSADYKRHLLGVLLGRGTRQALAEAVAHA